MKIKFPNSLFVFSGTITLCTVLFGNHDVTFAKPSLSLPQTPSSTTRLTPGQAIKLEPQQLRQYQILMKLKGTEIETVLNPSQRTQFKQELRSGKNFNQALSKLNLNADQKSRITSIINMNNLKLKFILTQPRNSKGERAK